MSLSYFDIYLLYLHPVTVCLFISLHSTLFLFLFLSLHLTSALSSFTVFLLLGLVHSLVILNIHYNLSPPALSLPSSRVSFHLPRSLPALSHQLIHICNFCSPSLSFPHFSWPVNHLLSCVSSPSCNLLSLYPSLSPIVDFTLIWTDVNLANLILTVATNWSNESTKIKGQKSAPGT